MAQANGQKAALAKEVMSLRSQLERVDMVCSPPPHPSSFPLLYVLLPSAPSPAPFLPPLSSTLYPLLAKEVMSLRSQLERVDMVLPSHPSSPPLLHPISTPCYPLSSPIPTSFLPPLPSPPIPTSFLPPLPTTLCSPRRS
eukprot:2067615-Rhodomonas_salina.1